MFDVKVLSREDTEQLLDIADVISVVEDVYRQKAGGQTVVWPMVFYEFDPGSADMDIKSGWLKGSGIFGLKLVSLFSANAEKGLPSLVGTIMVMDDETGKPLGFLDGSHITGMRTRAAGAIGAKYLANPDSENLLLVGAGHVAGFQAAAMLSLFPELKKVRVYDPISDELSEKFVKAIPNKLKDFFHIPAERVDRVSFESAGKEAMAEVTGDSQIIITVTPSKKPLIMKEWVSPGTHFSCIGSDMSGKEEIDPAIVGAARVFTDDKQQCINVGEIEIPVKEGFLKAEDIAGDIGQVITGEITGRQDSRQITVFDATGIVLLDLATARLALSKAEAGSFGATVNI